MTKSEKLAWIKSMAPAAQATEARYGIPASVVLAQAYLESADKLGNPGCSQLARECNNFFGIKARNGQAYREFRTAEFINGKKKVVGADFRTFPSVQDSFLAHAELISRLSRYAPAMTAANDPLAFAVELQHCGYSTNPKYAAELAGLITNWKLTHYDVKEKTS